MDLFFHYIKQRRREILASLLFCLIFIISFALYRLPICAVIYPAILCVLLSAVLIFLDFRRVRKKYRTLQMIQSMTDVITGTMPKVDGIEDEAYQHLIALLCKEQNSLLMNMNRRYSDMIDYYTLWAHQIKTPIASMRLNLQNEDSVLSRKLSLDLLRIEQYVEMVLTFLRLDSETSDYVIKEYDLDTIVKQSVRKFSGEFIARKLSLVYEALNTTVITDEKWLSFVIEQVLSNALKYTPSGSITITLEEPKILCIKDTGIGIAPEDLPRCFDNGYTGYNGRTDRKASGIGLYLCKRICSNLGHCISAESTVDRGTVIKIDLGQSKVKYE